MQYARHESRVLMHHELCSRRALPQDVGKKSERLRARVVRRGVTLASVAIALALLFVWTRIRVVQMGYEVSQINRQVSELVRQKNTLEADVARLKSPERLESVASQYFKMRLPQGDEIIFVNKQGK